MTEFGRDSLMRRLRTYGADLSRWPEGGAEAREALLRDREFRRVYEAERALDRGLAALGEALDAEVVQAGAFDRIRRRVALRGRPADILSGLRWQRVAAAVVVASMLGGAVDLAFADRAAESIDVALIDPLYGLDSVDTQ